MALRRREFRISAVKAKRALARWPHRLWAYQVFLIHRGRKKVAEGDLRRDGKGREEGPYEYRSAQSGTKC